jgi:hypothetical protein
MKPGELTLAASCPASPFQIGFEMLKRAANVDMTFIPAAVTLGVAIPAMIFAMTKVGALLWIDCHARTA